jgi:hypothetical protein
MLADNTSILTYHDNYNEFKNMLNSVLLDISKRFRSNNLIFNVEKTDVRFTPETVKYPLNLV